MTLTELPKPWEPLVASEALNWRCTELNCAVACKECSAEITQRWLRFLNAALESGVASYDLAPLPGFPEDKTSITLNLGEQP